jgi:hypothetical protein
MQPQYLSYLTSAAVALSCNLAVAKVDGANLPPSKEKATAALGNLAVPFEENRGQADVQVAFQARTLAGPLFVTKNGELVWNLN